jgi:acyl carrier protein
MFVLRYGDLNEVQIMMALEDELGFSMDEEMCNRVIQEKTTFIEFIKMVEEANLTSK